MPAGGRPGGWQRVLEQGDAMNETRLTALQRAALLLIRVYKLAFSPLFAGSCRFLPSCSDYAAEAIRCHGVMRGGYLAANRLARCHPFATHGVDPVPGALRRR